MSDWEDDDQGAAPPRSAGAGRGFTPGKRFEESRNSSGLGTMDDDSRPGDGDGFRGSRASRFNKEDKNGFGQDADRNNNDDEEGGGFRGRRDNDRGSFRGRGGRSYNNDNGDDGGFRGGRGGGRGGRNQFDDNGGDSEGFGGGGGGGFRGGRGGRSRNDDDNGDNSGGFGGGGGFRGSRGGRSQNDDDYGGDSGDFGGGGSGGFRGGRGGRSRNDDDNGGDSGFGGSGGGFRGGRGGFRGNRNQDDYGDGGFDGGNRDDDGGFGGRGRGRGGGRGGRSDNFGGGGDGEQPEKPREIYVPPELPSNEELFETGIEAGINFSQYDKLEVQASGEDVPPPMKSFETSGLRDHVLENIRKCKYSVPTPIQKYAIPVIMASRDVMGCAQTGSGKTAAFMIPIINKLLGESRDYSNMSGVDHVEPRAIVILPTRELVVQIYQESRKFAYNSVLKVQMLYGGTSTGHQLGQLFKGCDILVATPGRLIDILGKGKISFSSVQFVVLDEADRMLDMGFRDNIEKVLRHETMVPTGERQTLLFSATFPKDIQELALNYLNNYVFITVGIIGGACTDVEQHFVEVTKSEKRSKLMEMMEKEKADNTFKGILVFVEEKKTADFVAALLSENDYPTTSIHGDRLQRERELAIRDFVSGKMAILVGTSVAARGLDMKIVKHVINYDLPKDIHEYIHRIGRTGRLGNKGKATSFYDPRCDNRIVQDLLRILNQANQNVPEWLGEGGGGNDYGPASNFGGQDIRNFSDVQNSSKGAAQAVEEDEVW